MQIFLKWHFAFPFIERNCYQLLRNVALILKSCNQQIPESEKKLVHKIVLWPNKRRQILKGYILEDWAIIQMPLSFFTSHFVSSIALDVSLYHGSCHCQRLGRESFPVLLLLDCFIQSLQNRRKQFRFEDFVRRKICNLLILLIGQLYTNNKNYR